MKKVLLFAAVMLASFANAKTNVYNFTVFNVDENDESYVAKTINTTKDADFINKKIVNLLSGEDGAVTLVSEENGVYKYQGEFQSQSIYNPFAGLTKRNLVFNLDVTITDGQVALMFTNLKVTEKYMGYGMNDKRYDVAQKMIDYKKQRAIYDSKDKKAYSKEEKKNAAEVVDEISNEIGGSDAELALRLSHIEEALQ